MKTKEELNALKNEVEVLNQKLSTLTEEELEQVSGGGDGTGKDSQEPQKKSIVKLPFVEATLTKVTPQDICGDENP